MNGFIHSFQSMGAVDGPGLRYVIFMQGCPLRCIYCHNPDTWEFAGGSERSENLPATPPAGPSEALSNSLPAGQLSSPSSGQSSSPSDGPLCCTPQEAADRVLRCRPYLKNGGVTVTGGEPLMQPEFVEELFTILQGEGIHTALDTSGIGDPENIRRVLRHTDLVLADVKFLTAEDYKTYCGADFTKVKQFLSMTRQMRVPLWIRQVIVPGLNDTQEQMHRLAEFLQDYPNVEHIELLPFRKLCLEKYEALGIRFPLEFTPECTEEKVEELRQELEKSIK